MRVILINPNPLPAPDPPSLQVINSCAALARLAEVHLIARRGLGEDIAAYYGLELPPRLHLHLLPDLTVNWRWLRLSWNLPFFLNGLVTIWRLCRRAKVDALLVRNLKLAAFLLTWGRLLALPPIIFEAHEIFTVSYVEDRQRLGKEPDKEATLARRESYVYEHADGVITISQGLARRLGERFPALKDILVAPDGVDLAPFEDLPGWQGTERAAGAPWRVLYLGSLHHWKGVDVLIKTMTRLPEGELLVVGGNPESIRLHQDLAMKLGLAGRVRFPGFVAPGQRHRYWAEADICVLPLKPLSIASYFTSPLKLFEYMASGRPIVASDLPSMREILTPEKNALLVRPDDPEALAAGIRKLISDPALAESLARQARSDVEAYTWDRRAEKIVQFIEKVVEKPAG